MSQSGWLTSSSGFDVTITAGEKAIFDPDVRPGCCIPELSFTNSTPEALKMEIKTKCFNNHGSAFPKGMSTARAELLPTDGPVR